MKENIKLVKPIKEQQILNRLKFDEIIENKLENIQEYIKKDISVLNKENHY